jgi:hypothetical protein
LVAVDLNLAGIGANETGPVDATGSARLRVQPVLFFTLNNHRDALKWT